MPYKNHNSLAWSIGGFIALILVCLIAFFGFYKYYMNDILYRERLNQMEEVTKQLSLIMEDGEVTAGEWTTLEEVQKKLLEFRRRADENLAVLEKAARLGKFD